jgi:hypothetical protein
LIGELSPAEQQSVMCHTARGVYRLD